MVRTYAFNASSRSEVFEKYKHTATAPRYHQESHSTSSSHDTASSQYADNRKYHLSDSQSISNSITTSNSTTESSPLPNNHENNNQQMNFSFPPLNQSNIYQSSFHSSMIDSVGSIIGLRLLYMNGQLVYVPVEPHVNMMINKQFGNVVQVAAPQVVLPQIHQNVSILAQSAMQSNKNSPPPPPPLMNPLVRGQSNSDVYQNQNKQEFYNQPIQASLSRQSANQQYRQNTMNAKFGSLPNLTHRQGLSSQEQHKLELQQQIEDNKRRREMEKQKELDIEQREIRKWEEYQKRVREEEERERRQIQEKARAIELRNQQVYEKQQQRKKERQPSLAQQYPQQQPYLQHNQPNHYQNSEYDYHRDNEQIRPAENTRTSNSFSEYSQQQQMPQQVRNQPRYEQQHGIVREPRPDSSQPRQTEWWEKKPSWQDRASERQSAVIPTLRGKPPSVPDSQRGGHDSPGNMGEHQSRPSSHRTSSTQRESDGQSEESEDRYSSGERKKPSAFTVSA